MHQLPQSANLTPRPAAAVGLKRQVMLKRPVLVRGLVLLMQHGPVPVVLKPHLQHLHLVRGGEAGHLLAIKLHELPGGPVGPK